MDTDIAKWPNWETDDLIGRGSFGEVYRIHRNVFDEIENAALKVISIPKNANEIDELYCEGLDDESITNKYEEHLKSIIAEYTMMRKMRDCTNIVDCDDVHYEKQKNGVGWNIFIKMELLTPLLKTLGDNISEEIVIKLGKDICTALCACKKFNIIHRDIKPQNIFVSSDGDYKLGDFGIAKIAEKTMYGTYAGTRKYMAPEVYANKPYGVTADIYSLGLVLYWLLNNCRLPFLPTDAKKISFGMEDKAIKRRLSGEEIPAPINGSDRLKAIVLKACAFNQEDRYLSPTQMMEALDALNDMDKVSFAKETDSVETENINNDESEEQILSQNINLFEQYVHEENTARQSEKKLVNVKKNSFIKKFFFDFINITYSIESLKYYRSIQGLVFLLSMPLIFSSFIYPVMISNAYVLFDYITGFLGILCAIVAFGYFLKYSIAITINKNKVESLNSKNLLEEYNLKYNKREFRYISNIGGTELSKKNFGCAVMVISALLFLACGYVEIDSRIHIKIEHTPQEQLAKNLDFAGMLFTFTIIFLIGLFVFFRGKQLDEERKKYCKMKGLEKN